MYIDVNFTLFCDRFRAMGRADQFTYDALRALYDYVIEWEESCNEKYELDVIELCCEFVEMTREEVAKQYSKVDIEELLIAELRNGDLLVRVI
jgi:hypothetical protein